MAQTKRNARTTSAQKPPTRNSALKCTWKFDEQRRVENGEHQKDLLN